MNVTDTWLDEFGSALTSRRARSFPVVKGRAWRLGQFVVHIKMTKRGASATAITAAEEIGGTRGLDAAIDTHGFALQVESDPHVAAQQIVEQLRAW